MKQIQWERIASILLSLTLGGTMLYFLFKYAFPILLPFLLAYLISLAIRPLARKLSSMLHLSQKLLSCILLIVLILGGAYLLWLLIVKLITEAASLVQQILESGALTNALESVRLWLLPLSQRFGIDLLSNREGLEKALGDLLSSALSALATRLPEIISALFSALPSVFLIVIITLVSGFYFCADGERISSTLVAALPKALQAFVLRLKSGCRDLFRRYVKAYLYLFLITFIQLLIGLLILRVEYAFLLALLIAFADLLPILGVGTILFPWGLILILQKNYYIGFGLLILYLVIALVRQIMEPRLIGKSLGLHPLLALLSSYAGLITFGFWGMLLCPITAILIKGVLSSVFRSKSENAA